MTKIARTLRPKTLSGVILASLLCYLLVMLPLVVLASLALQAREAGSDRLAGRMLIIDLPNALLDANPRAQQTFYFQVAHNPATCMTAPTEGTEAITGLLGGIVPPAKGALGQARHLLLTPCDTDLLVSASQVADMKTLNAQQIQYVSRTLHAWQHQMYTNLSSRS